MAFKALRGDRATMKTVWLEKMRSPRTVAVWEKRSWEEGQEERPMR